MSTTVNRRIDYGRTPGEWSLSEDRHRGQASGAGQAITLQTDMLLGIEANHARARHSLWEGEALYCVRPLIERSALAIKGLTYMPTGATGLLAPRGRRGRCADRARGPSGRDNRMSDAYGAAHVA